MNSPVVLWRMRAAAGLLVWRRTSLCASLTVGARGAADASSSSSSSSSSSRAGRRRSSAAVSAASLVAADTRSSVAASSQDGAVAASATTAADATTRHKQQQQPQQQQQQPQHPQPQQQPQPQRAPREQRSAAADAQQHESVSASPAPAPTSASARAQPRASSAAVSSTMASGNPIRHAIPWRAEHFYDEAELDKELRRVLNVCHGCRRCFNLCETFPDLFAAVDSAPSQEMDTVTSAQVTDALNKCTLCDMCYLTKCPYVPPHPFNIDLPSLVVRQRAVANEGQNAAASERVRDDASRPERLTGLYEVVEVAEGTSRNAKLKPKSWLQRVMLDTDRVGRMAGRLSALANWALDTRNALTRTALESVAGIDRRAKLPPYVPTAEQYMRASAASSPASGSDAAPPPDARVVLFVGCLPNYSVPRMARAAQLVLERNGAHVVPYYERCCGMPQLEQGLVKDVAERAKATARDLQPYLEQGYTVVSLVSSCTLMLRQHWKLLAPEDDAVLSLATGTRDVCEYVNALAQRRGGLAGGLAPLPFGVALHQACHMRAQNVGAPSLQLLKAIPGASVASVDKCSGHGGSIGVSTEYHETARKLAEPAVSRVERARKQKGDTVVASDCPLACKHLNQVCGGARSARNDGVRVDESGHVLDAVHPIELVALSYGLVSADSLPLPRARAGASASE